MLASSIIAKTRPGEGRFLVVRLQGVDEVICLHVVRPNLAAMAASPRWKATRTAVSFMSSAVAVSLIERPSIAMDFTTRRCPSLRMVSAASTCRSGNGGILGLGSGKLRLEIVYIKEDPLAVAAVDIDNSVRDRQDPGKDRFVRTPGWRLVWMASRTS